MKTAFKTLLDCFRSGQMSAGQMQAYMKEDAVFAVWVQKQMSAVVDTFESAKLT